MGKKAVDIVVIPDRSTRKMAIDINMRLRCNCENNIKLGHKQYLPHISLCMGVLDESNIPDIDALLTRTATNFKLGKLRLIEMISNETDSGKIINLLSVQKKHSLQKLHQKIVADTKIWLDDKPAKEQFADDQVAESSLDWVSSFRIDASFENFFPHITLGYGKIELKTPVKDFYPEKLAMCHLGDHCTCKNIITAIDIN